MSDKPCYVYAIATMRDGLPCAPVKVGITTSPHARLCQVQTGSPHRLSFALLLMLDDREFARTVEQGTLHYLRDHALAGEWLDLSPLEVIGEIVAEIVQASGCRVAHPQALIASVVQ